MNKITNYESFFFFQVYQNSLTNFYIFLFNLMLFIINDEVRTYLETFITSVHIFSQKGQSGNDQKGQFLIYKKALLSPFAILCIYYR